MVDHYLTQCRRMACQPDWSLQPPLICMLSRLLMTGSVVTGFTSRDHPFRLENAVVRLVNGGIRLPCIKSCAAMLFHSYAKPFSSSMSRMVLASWCQTWLMLMNRSWNV